MKGAASSPGPGEDRWVKVWDLPTRLFHWGLVLLVVVDVLTGWTAPQWWLGVHIWAGYGLVALMAFRLVWGLYGPEYSRVASFLHPPRRTLEHLQGLVLLRPPHYMGHNPTGALMVFALTGVLLALVVTGLLVLGGEEKQGPLATVISYTVGSAAKTGHRWLAYVLLGMVTCHIVGVGLTSLLTRDNLVRAMITGWKRLPPEAPIPTPRPARPGLALAWLVLLAGSAAGVLYWLAAFPLPHHLRHLPLLPTYQQECGVCHNAFHPGLLPTASWRRLMSSLAEHFGEDVSLESATTRTLLVWLVENAAETFDTESANRFRIVAPQESYRITATPYWVRKHASLPPAVFRRQRIHSQANCEACHRDAASGRFDDQAIAIPEE